MAALCCWGELAANDADGMEEREAVRILVGFEGGFMHQARMAKCTVKRP